MRHRKILFFIIINEPNMLSVDVIQIIYVVIKEQFNFNLHPSAYKLICIL